MTQVVFTLGHTVPLEESRSVEFKEVHSPRPVNAIVDAADVYAVGFLNSEGGRILWGIRDADRIVVGVWLPSEQRDELRRVVTNKLHTIQPPPDPTRFRLTFHEVAGEKVPADTCVVELSVPAGNVATPYYTSGSHAYVRLDSAIKKLTGPQLTEWIRTKLGTPFSINGVYHGKLKSLADRVRRVFEAHGLEPAHLAAFFQKCQAPFSIALTNLCNEGAFLAWLDEQKIDWISKVFLVRREWLDGQDQRIHEEHLFDKQPKHFLSTVRHHTDAFRQRTVDAVSEAYFLRWGRGWNWRGKGDFNVIFVLAVPLARFGNERIIFKYVCDFTRYPWDYARTHIQLRAWSQLLAAEAGVVCHCWEVPHHLGDALEANARFLGGLLHGPNRITRSNWCLDDYEFSSKERAQAQADSVSVHVTRFLQLNGLV